MRVLAIGAHFDDVELGCGGALLLHRRRGDGLTVFVATTSDFADPRGRPVRAAGEPRREGEAAARLLGAELVCGEFPTNDLACDEALVKALRLILDHKQPEVVYTHWSGDPHLDHRHLALASLSAARHAPTLLMYRSSWYDGAEEFPGRVYVDVSAVMDQKLGLLSAYHSEDRRRGEQWRQFLRDSHRLAGRRIGAAYAEAFAPVRCRLPL